MAEFKNLTVGKKTMITVLAGDKYNVKSGTVILKKGTTKTIITIGSKDDPLDFTHITI